MPNDIETRPARLSRERANAPAFISLWRCSRCGKWSHAARRPRQHLRWITLGVVGDDLRHDDVVVKHSDPSSDPDALDIVQIKCGPFDTYHARLAQTASPAPPESPGCG